MSHAGHRHAIVNFRVGWPFYTQDADQSALGAGKGVVD